MTLGEVETWASVQGIAPHTLARYRDECLRVAISRLLQAIYREQYGGPSRLHQAPDGRWFLRLGAGDVLSAPVTGPLPFQRIELAGLPDLRRRGRTTRLTTAPAFLRALRRCLSAAEVAIPFDRLTADFDNSFANLVLNRVLAHVEGPDSAALEPIYEGHTHYPFPALRLGPSLSQIAACSNLSRHPVLLPLVAIGTCRFVSPHYENHEVCLGDWAGLTGDCGSSVAFPVHPWQFQLSPVIAALRQLGLIRTIEPGIAAVPLASQRTCRITATGFDVKLPIDVTLTGEHRLLYPMNAANAPIVSALARALLDLSECETLEFQLDAAALLHPDPTIGCHLAAIIRSPLPERSGECVVPALNLWTGPRLARSLLRIDSPERASEVFLAYCRVLMEGPIMFYARWGMAFEPHLQNVLVRIRGGMPVGIILRDLDGTILDPERIPLRLREQGLWFPMAPWDAMPPFTIGGGRLVHALSYGHLGPVMSYLTTCTGLEATVLTASIDAVWNRLTERTGPWPHQAVRELRDQTRAVRCSLAMRLERSMTMAFR